MKKSNYQIIGILIIITLTYLLRDANYQGFWFAFVVGIFFIIGFLFIIGTFPRKKEKE